MPGTENWTRPKSVPVPTVWRRFTGLRKMPDGKTPKFVIQDVPEDRHSDVIDFMVEHFYRDEVLCECLKLLEDPVSMEEFKGVWKELLKQNMALVAFVEGDDGQATSQIAGANITGISHKSEKHTADMYKGRVTRRIVRDVLEYACNIVDVYEHYGVQEYMTALGLCVDPIYRGQGLGLDILKARFDLGEAVGLQVSMTAFTGIASQTLAHRAGFEVLVELPYEEFKDEDGNPVYPNIKSKSMKIMARRIKC